MEVKVFVRRKGRKGLRFGLRLAYLVVDSESCAGKRKQLVQG